MASMIRVMFIGIAFASVATPTSAQQTLRFDNATPPLTIQLSDAVEVSFEANGNVHAQCALDGFGQCIGMPPTTCPMPPATSLLADEFSSAPLPTGAYPPGTTLRLFPSVSGADNCRRLTSARTPAGSGWSGLIGDGLELPVDVVLAAGGQHYDFSLKCFGDGGMQTSATITLMTSVAVPANCAAVPPIPGFSHDPTHDELTDLRNIIGVPLTPFPSTGTGLGQLRIPRSRWTALRFTVPSDPAVFFGLLKRVSWFELMAGEANLNHTYISISQCPGDFRVPAAGNAPAGDATLAHGCRNLRPSGTVIGINYAPTLASSPSTPTSCNLRHGETYYFNMILADPFDGGGFEPGETSCVNPGIASCGIQLQAN